MFLTHRSSLQRRDFLLCPHPMIFVSPLSNPFPHQVFLGVLTLTPTIRHDAATSDVFKLQDKTFKNEGALISLLVGRCCSTHTFSVEKRNRYSRILLIGIPLIFEYFRFLDRENQIQFHLHITKPLVCHFPLPRGVGFSPSTVWHCLLELAIHSLASFIHGSTWLHFLPFSPL